MQNTKNKDNNNNNNNIKKKKKNVLCFFRCCDLHVRKVLNVLNGLQTHYVLSPLFIFTIYELLISNFRIDPLVSATNKINCLLNFEAARK